MHLSSILFLLPVAAGGILADQRPLVEMQHTTAIPVSLFAQLERSARLVDIAYCVGTTGTGIAPPFSCASRCRDFPELRLVTTWNTGVLMRDSCGYIAVDDERREVVVAFRGTYSLANTVVDLSTIPQEYVPYDPDDPDGGSALSQCANCTVHMGFLASWHSARELVLPAVAQARAASSPPYRVHLIGHSLGGAVAALAALEMKAVHGWADVKVTTFGEPRIGNDQLAAYLEDIFHLRADDDDSTTTTSAAAAAAYHRVTHRNDPVPLLPLAEWSYTSHAGETFIAKADLSPAPADVHSCRGRADPSCSAGSGNSLMPPGLNLWEIFFAHRDYFWRLGLCVPGGDPADWGRERYNYTDEL